jgi:cytoskeleton protein RodZ
MPPIGETLREARMRQRLDIADVESRTKIRAKYLRALENEEWSLLPGPTFVRTFLRTYAEVVGIDPHLLVEEYRLNHEPREDYDFQPLAPRPRETRRDSRRGPRRAPPGPPRPAVVFALAAVAVLAVLFVLGLAGGEDEPTDRSGTAPAVTERRPAPPSQAKRPAAASIGVRARIAPTEPTYVCVDTGPGTEVVFEGTLSAPRTFRDRRRVRLNLGRRTVSIRANGRPVDFEPGADPLGLALTRKGTVELPAGKRPCA